MSRTRALILRLGLTVPEAARLLGVDPATVYRWHRGVMPRERHEELASVVLQELAQRKRIGPEAADRYAEALRDLARRDAQAHRSLIRMGVTAW